MQDIRSMHHIFADMDIGSLIHHVSKDSREFLK